MCHGCSPLITAGSAFHETCRSVRHPDAPFPAVTAVVRQIHPIHHIILVAENVLISKATYIVYLYHGRFTVFIICLVPGVLVDKPVDKRIRHSRINSTGFLVTDGIGHAIRGSSSSSTHICVLSGTALLLAVTSAVFRIEQVGDA